MTAIVHKYPLTGSAQAVDMPIGSVVLTVATQSGTPMLWALVDPDEPSEPRTFVAVGTGQSLSSAQLAELKYVGTAHDVDGVGLVFHIFERRRQS